MVPITARVHNQGVDKTVQPRSNKQGQRRRHEAPTKIVENLPSGQPGERILPAPSLEAGNARQQPAGNLPIPANPAVPTAHVREVAGWIFLVQQYIAQQPRPCIASLHKVMAEDPVLGKAPLEGPLERIDIIDPLADE